MAATLTSTVADLIEEATKADLVRQAKELGLTVKSRDTKESIAQAIAEASAPKTDDKGRPLTPKGFVSTAGAKRDYRRVALKNGKPTPKANGGKYFRVVEDSATRNDDGSVTMTYLTGKGAEKEITLPKKGIAAVTLRW